MRQGKPTKQLRQKAIPTICSILARKPYLSDICSGWDNSAIYLSILTHQYYLTFS